jgi:hypothetical protein
MLISDIYRELRAMIADAAGDDYATFNEWHEWHRLAALLNRFDLMLWCDISWQ